MRGKKLAWRGGWGALAVCTLVLAPLGSVALADCGFSNGDAEHGKAIYEETCFACHGEDGRGAVPGAPDFTQTGGVLSKPHDVLTNHIENGFSEPGKPLAMPAKGANPDLTDQDAKDVHAYLHKAFGCG